MEMRELGRYTEAIACLRQTLSEGRKSTNVDIELMLTNVQRCEAIVQELLLNEHDSLISNALTSLAVSLTAHQNVLSKKIHQLNAACTAAPVSPRRSRTGSLTAADSHTPGLNHSGSPLTTAEPPATPREEEKEGRHREIESTIVRRGAVSFDDVIGLTEAKQSLQDAVVMPLVFPHLFTGGRKPWQRILLYGPPGTGKSHLAQAISTEVKATFYCVSSSDLISSFVGESEKLIKELFQHAHSRCGQSVIFIDEIDSLCRRRSSREDEGSRRIKTELLVQMDGAAMVREGPVRLFLLCATNCPWDLDTAFLRRFQKRIYIPLPDATSRKELLKLHCRDTYTDLGEADWTQLADSTEGYSGSDLSTLALGALFQPIRDLQTARHWTKSNDGLWSPCPESHSLAVKVHLSDLPAVKVCPRAVTLQDFLQAVQTHRPTVTPEELDKFAEFTSCFGQSG